MAKPARHILVCTNTRPPNHPRGSCGALGAGEVFSRFQEEFMKRNLFNKAILSGSTCVGPCSFGPNVIIYPEGTWYSKVTPDDVPEIINEHILNEKTVERLLMPDTAWE